MKLENKIAIITGGGAGLGQAAAFILAQEGAKVVVVDINPKMGNETVDKISNKGKEALFIEEDVSSLMGAKRVVKRTINKFGRVDVLFNNVGIRDDAKVHDLSKDVWDRTLNVNLTSVYLMSHFVIRKMLETGGGVILNNASTYALIGVRNRPAYSASKGGIVSLTRQMALDYAESNIRINCICPGPIMTSGLQEYLDSHTKDSGAYMKNVLSKVPIGRFGKPEEIAKVVAFLLSDEASYITGVAIPVDGGQTI